MIRKFAEEGDKNKVNVNDINDAFDDTVQSFNFPCMCRIVG